MKRISKQTKNVVFRIFCLIIAVFLIVSIPKMADGVNDNLDKIYGSFVGEKSEFEGIIEIWNIDTFESGSTSKTAFLNSAAKDFQKKYKGAYVLVRNISEQECENMLAQGQTPDLFSCSYGVSTKIKPYIQSFGEHEFDLQTNFLEAGKNEIGELYGAAWCSGLYFVFSTKEALSKAGVTYDENFLLKDNVFNLGYVENGKKPKNIYSVSFASKGYVMPKAAAISYNESEANLISELSFSGELKLSQYEAYVEFLLGKSTMLLGSQRDVVRLTSREQNGKISDLVIEPILSSSDLVQFLFMAKTDDSLKAKYIKKFAALLLGEKMQAKLANYNMFPTIKNVFLSYEIGVMRGITLENLEGLEIKNIFLPISDIKKLQ